MRRVGFVVAGCLLYSAQTVSAQSSAPALEQPRLRPGELRQRTLAPADVHEYQVHLAAGDFLELIVQPHGINVGVSLVQPDGGQVMSADTSSDPDFAERLLAVAGTTGIHVVRVSPVDDKARPGTYSISISSLRPATREDRLRAEGMRAIEAGRRIEQHPAPGSREEAEEQYTRAIASFTEAGDREGEGLAETLAAVNYTLRLHPATLSHAERAVALCREVPGHPYLSTALSVLGSALAREGQPEAAIRALEESISIAHERGWPYREANARMTLSSVFGRSGRTELAVEQLRAVIELARAGGWTQTEAGALNNLAIAMKDLGDYATATAYYERSLSLTRTLGDRTFEANLLNNIGNLYRLQGDYTRSRQSHEAALRLARQVGNKEHEARALNTLGWTYYRLGDPRRAVGYYRQALVIRRTLRDPVSLASTLDGLGLALHALGRTAEGLPYIEEAVRLRHRMAEPYGEAESLTHRAQVKRDQGDLEGALEDLTAAVGLTDSIRGTLLTPETRASFIAVEQTQYDLYVDVLMEFDARSPGEGFAARALEASEHGRARVLLESLIEGRTEVREGIDPALLASERAQEKQLDEATARLSRLLAAAAAPAQIDAARATLDRATVQATELDARIRRESPRYAALTQPRARSAAEIQRDLLDPDTLLLEFRLGEKQSWLWCVGTNTLRSFPLPARATIDKAGRELYELLTARQPKPDETMSARSLRIRRADARWRTASQAFSRMLLGPAAAALGDAWRGKRLLIVASDVLQYLPFAALPDPALPRRALVHGHEVVYAPSASVVSVIRQEAAARAAPERELAVIADPVFAIDDPRVAGTVRSASARGGRADSGAAGLASAPDTFARLPFSREEARAIASLVPATDRLEAVGFDANLGLVTSHRLAGYRFVHFATHGVLDTERPELSGLVLSLIGSDGRPEDGFLRTRDIYNLRLSADLVVLSACQTALGKEIRGEGLMGLTRGFMYAGVPRVVASLWQVDDLATAELMRLFYQGLLRHGLRPAAALREAQRQLAATPRWAPPFYWSGFILQGEWK